MNTYYQMTELEQWTEDLFRRLGVSHPSRISIEYLSERLNIWVHYLDVPSKAVEAAAGTYSMFLDSRLSPERQRLDFLHELCHLLRHAGDGTLLPGRYTPAQEDEADRFVPYAAIPFSLFSSLPVPDKRTEAIDYVAETFQVPEELALHRIDQIQRRILQGQLLAVAESARGADNRNRSPRMASGGTRFYSSVHRKD